MRTLNVTAAGLSALAVMSIGFAGIQLYVDTKVLSTDSAKLNEKVRSDAEKARKKSLDRLLRVGLGAALVVALAAVQLSRNFYISAKDLDTLHRSMQTLIESPGRGSPVIPNLEEEKPGKDISYQEGPIDKLRALKDKPPDPRPRELRDFSEMDRTESL